jgi:DivIVA domain-containing protein
MTNELSSDDVRGAVFAKPPLGKRGYDPKSVHELLQLAARKLDGRGYLSAADVRAATLRTASLLQRGYDKAEVDAFVDRVIAAIQALDS